MANTNTPGYIQTHRINQRMAYNAMRNDASNLTAVTATFDEVYYNLDELDEKISGVRYDAVTGAIVIPSSIGTYVNEGIVLK